MDAPADAGRSAACLRQVSCVPHLPAWAVNLRAGRRMDVPVVAGRYVRCLRHETSLKKPWETNAQRYSAFGEIIPLCPSDISCRKARQAKQPQMPKSTEFGGGECSIG